MDLGLTVNDGKVKLALYDKRDDFPFEVRCFPDLSGNIHGGRAHGVVVGQLQRFAKACDHFPRFAEKAKTLTARLLRQGFDKKKLSRKSETFFDTRQDLLKKYGRTRATFVEACF